MNSYRNLLDNLLNPEKEGTFLELINYLRAWRCGSSGTAPAQQV
jgi:hypothetical protein